MLSSFSRGTRDNLGEIEHTPVPPATLFLPEDRLRASWDATRISIRVLHASERRSRDTWGSLLLWRKFDVLTVPGVRIYIYRAYGARDKNASHDDVARLREENAGAMRDGPSKRRRKGVKGESRGVAPDVAEVVAMPIAIPRVLTLWCVRNP